MEAAMQWFTVRYLADDGEIRRMEVEAEDEADARWRALEQDMGNYGGDSIHTIIDVSSGRL